MANTLVKVYNTLSNVDGARKALLASGFAADHVHIDTQIDDASAVEGNFILEYKDTDKGGDDSAFDRLMGGDDPNEGRGRTPVRWLGCYLLTVDADDEEQIARASDIMDRFGAMDAEAAAAMRTRPH